MSPANEARIADARARLHDEIEARAAHHLDMVGVITRDIHRRTIHAIGEHCYACKVRLGFTALAMGVRMDPPGPIRPRVRAGVRSTA